METRPSEFLGHLFQGVESGYVTLFDLKDRAKSTRLPIDDLSGVDTFVDTYKDTLYYNLGVTRENLPQGVRGGKADVSNICCLWADVDFPKTGNDKKYPTLEAITSALADMPLPYTALIFTGGGLHVYWFLKEPYEINGVVDAEKFESTLSKPWVTLLKIKLAKYGDFQLDSVHDVSRMLRIPGSWHKNGEQCVVREANYDVRYLPEDFERYVEIIDCNKLVPTYTPKFTAEITGHVDPTRLDALINNSRDFKAIWTGKKVYPSGSEADGGVAYHSLMAGWSDDEVANLLVAFNKKTYPERIEKLFRKEREYGNYIGRVLAWQKGLREEEIALARLGNGFFSEDGGEPVDEQPDGDASVPDGGLRATKRDEDISRLSKIFGIPIARWIQVGKEDPIYTLVLATGQQIKIGGEAAVVDSSKVFERRIYSELHRKIKSFTKVAWDNACSGLARIVEVVESPEVIAAEVARTGIRQYIEEQRAVKESDRDAAIRHNRAWHNKEFVHIHAPSVIRYLNMHGGGKKWTNAEFINAMRQLGYASKAIHYEHEGKRSSKSYWLLPKEEYEDILDDRK